MSPIPKTMKRSRRRIKKCMTTTTKSRTKKRSNNCLSPGNCSVNASSRTEATTWWRRQRIETIIWAGNVQSSRRLVVSIDRLQQEQDHGHARCRWAEKAEVRVRWLKSMIWTRLCVCSEVSIEKEICLGMWTVLVGVTDGVEGVAEEMITWIWMSRREVRGEDRQRDGAWGWG